MGYSKAKFKSNDDKHSKPAVHHYNQKGAWVDWNKLLVEPIFKNLPDFQAIQKEKRQCCCYTMPLLIQATAHLHTVR
jgi:hypothetical protein